MNRIRPVLVALIATTLVIAASPAANAGPKGVPVAEAFLMHGDAAGAAPLQSVYDQGSLPDRFSISVVASNAESVEFFLNGDLVRLENIDPYFINGDEGGDWAPFDLPSGAHELVAIPYSEDDAGGKAGTPLTFEFRITAGYLVNPDLSLDPISPTHPGIQIPLFNNDGPDFGNLPPGTGVTWPDADFRVNTTVDAHDAKAGDGVCEANIAGQRRCTLRAAIEEANALRGGQIAIVSFDEPYKLSLGELEVTAGIELLGIERPTIDGDGGSRVFYFNSSRQSVVDGLVITGGYAYASNGGNIWVQDSGVIFRSVEITKGLASNGGGIAISGDLSSVQIVNSVISVNSGGENARDFSGTPGRNQNGGGILIIGGSSVSLRRTAIVDNISLRGGGLFAAGDTNLSISNSSFLENEARLSGGAMMLQRDSHVEMRFSTVAGNQAGTASAVAPNTRREGGGITLESQDFRMAGTIITDNEVLYGNTSAADCYTTNATNYQAPILSGRGNLIGNADGCAFVDIEDGSQRGVVAGSTETPLTSVLWSRFDEPLPHRDLRSGSPALRLGREVEPFTIGMGCPSTDQLGRPRPEGRCDAGAVQNSD